MPFPSELVLATIVHPWWPKAHAIVVRSRVVYDGSLLEPISPQDHPLKKWYVATITTRDL